jgi:hypothetical protein
VATIYAIKIHIPMPCNSERKGEISRWAMQITYPEPKTVHDPGGSQRWVRKRLGRLSPERSSEIEV